MLLYFLLKFSVDDGYQAEGGEFFAGFQPFNEEMTFGEGPAMDILALEVSFGRECFEVSEPLIMVKAGRSPDLVADIQVK